MKVLSLETFRLGLNNLRLHKLRSLLTSLGIIFGVAAVICILSISEGASADELRLIQLLGTRNIIVNSVKPATTRQISQGNTNLIEYGLTKQDVSIIEKIVPHIAHVVPLKTVGYKVQNGRFQAGMEAVGTTPDFFEVVNITVGRGRPLSGFGKSASGGRWGPDSGISRCNSWSRRWCWRRPAASWA